MSAECDIHKCDLCMNDEMQYFCQECYLENKIMSLESQIEQLNKESERLRTALGDMPEIILKQEAENTRLRDALKKIKYESGSFTEAVVIVEEALKEPRS